MMAISCKQATDYISKKEEGKLTLLQRYHLWRHLAVCILCRWFHKQNAVITTAIKHNNKNILQPLSDSDKNDFIKSMEKVEEN